MRHAAVEAQLVDILGDFRQRAMRGLADLERRVAKLRGLRRRRFLRNLGDLADEAPQPLHETPRALHAFLGPDHVALGR